MSDKFILVDQKVVGPVTIEEWGKWFETADRIVEKTEINHALGDVEVSTVFLGLDHRWGGGGPPIVFETMIFTDREELDQMQWRYCTWDEAVAGHAHAVHMVRTDIWDDDYEDSSDTEDESAPDDLTPEQKAALHD